MEESGDSKLTLARRYLDVDRPERALAALESGADLDDVEYWEVRAEALLELDRPGEAADAARRGLDLEADNVLLLDLLALAEIALDNDKEAERILATALEFDPDNPLLLAHRALALARRKRYDDARRDIASAMQIAPDWTPVLTVRAQVAVLSKDAHASEYIDDLLEEDPENRMGHALRGGLSLQQARFRPAREALDEAARLDPSDPDVAAAAREARVLLHPVLAPVRPVWRYGRWRSYFTYLTISAALAAAGLKSIRYVVVSIWLVIVILSWTAPRILMWREKRKYGGF
jgi:tetratricopeptide (TPR) repeat protein